MSRARADAPAFGRCFVRFALAFVSLFVAFGYFASLSHMALVAHTACAEHGKLVHVQAGRSVSAAPSADVTVTAPDSVSSEEHEHCVIGIARTGEARVAAPAAGVSSHAEPAVVVAPLAVLSLAPAPATFPAPIEILLLSPKSSPPV
jgi:hypothetical protein